MIRTLLLDLETTRSGRIRQVGALLNGDRFERTEQAGSRAVLEALDELARGADVILGHNLLGHDFPILRAAFPWLELLQKPVIDTLYLSPLAFPQNPYHGLVKNYKLVSATVNNPVADAQLAAAVFSDQQESFAAIAEKNAALIDFYRFCFEKSLFNTFSGEGMATVFARIASKAIGTADEALDCFLDLSAGRVCEAAVRETIAEKLQSPERRPAVAYCLAWLQVAGGNSVLPPWVRHRFPEIPAMIKTIREQPCGRPDCKYCAENHDPEGQLHRFFGFPSFRQQPRTDNGESLQWEIVRVCLADRPVMGILPTGGGKSLCDQLPALVRYWRRGVLTVVISPLQALMKDQVDNLVRKTGTLFAEAVYGLQTLPERGAVFERIRLGDTAILYVSPEQLRSISVRNVLRQREIGCWVFDEAHCLSKWGHDFRPDYLYAARFIREFASEQNQPIPPACCFTATAKTSVIEEIKIHFSRELDLDLQLFTGGVERENLSFEVIPVSAAEKLEKTHEIIAEQLDAGAEPAGVIVYAATRKATEEIEAFLNRQGVQAEAFHAGFEAAEKKDIIEGFVAGKIPVICATNAFGMGIDKDNIRLVLHYEMPGSLENYLQEAGRAGRDMNPARCILLYDPGDADKQFQMGALSEVKQAEIARILRALRRKKRNQNGEIVVTSDELIRDEDLPDLHNSRADTRDTKVKAAIAWLERAGFLQRNQNMTEVFQGKPLFESMAEAAEKIDRLSLSRPTRNMWLSILQGIISSPEGGGIRADALAESLFPNMEALVALEKKTGQTAAQIVITALHDMADAGLIDQGIMLSAMLRPKGKNRALTVFQAACDLENKLIRVMETEDPDADNGSWVELDIRRLNQKLNNQGFDTTPEVLRQLIKGISYDGKGLAAAQGSFELNYINRHRYQVRLQRSWGNVKRTIFLRQGVAHVILHTLVAMAEKQAPGTGDAMPGGVRVSFTSDDLSKAIRSDIALNAQVKKVLPAIDRALMYLHEQKVITLQGGLAVLRQAMTIRMTQTAKGRQYNKGDFKPLAVHYREKRLQVHVMIRYATLALDKLAGALRLVLDYFTLGRIKFINKYFQDDKALIEKATTAESYRTIVENLRNPVQISAVGKPVDDNMLILAGPGSGKTTVIAHRCAYLLTVERVPARQILVLCFNHGSAVLLRQRLANLVGAAARAVAVATYHGAAMRLSGISIRDMVETGSKNGIDFDRMIKDATGLLNGEADIPGMDPDEVRDRLLAGYSHILVDEYQDIDEDQYALVSAIAGRSLSEEDGRLSIMAVGDDDQNIYTFRGANVRFIRRFQKDYTTGVIHLVENYRSTRHIIAASNALIRANRDRMKGEHPIVINRDRASNLPGGRWAQIDPMSDGRVLVVSVSDLAQQAAYVNDEIDRLRHIDPSAQWHDFAVLSRTRAPLGAVRTVLESAGYPLKTTMESGLPIHRIREFHIALNWLMEREKDNRRAGDLKTGLAALRSEMPATVWWQLVDAFLDEYLEETVDSVLPVSRVVDRLYGFMSEQRREKVIGQGIFMSTIHSAKGMEFPHVFILDGDWTRPMEQRRQEEERRVMYVGMTRAEETLRLLKIADRPNPFLKDIKSSAVASIPYRGKTRGNAPVAPIYELLGLEDIFLDYAGCFPQTHPIHGFLAQLSAGQCVRFRSDKVNVDVHDAAGRRLARLSKEGAKKWRGRLDRILDVRVAAMLRRRRDDPDENFRDRVKADAWELPVLEVVR